MATGPPRRPAGLDPRLRGDDGFGGKDGSGCPPLGPGTLCLVGGRLLPPFPGAWGCSAIF